MKTEIDNVRSAMMGYLNDFLPSSNSLFCVLHLNEHLASIKGDPFVIQKVLKSYFKRVDNKVFSRNSKNKCFRYVVIENLTKQYKRTHVQFVISVPKHLNRFQLIECLKDCIDQSKCSLEWHVDVGEVKGLNRYNTKDIKNDNTSAFDEVNSYRWISRTF